MSVSIADSSQSRLHLGDGDGIIFIYPVKNVVRMRIGERDTKSEPEELTGGPLHCPLQGHDDFREPFRLLRPLVKGLPSFLERAAQGDRLARRNSAFLECTYHASKVEETGIA